MKLVRNVLQDLIDKKLWPVAVALLAALVAVPVLLGGSSDATPAPDTAAVTPSTPNGLAGYRDVARGEVVGLAEQAAGKVSRTGKVRNPFVQHHVPKAQDPETAVKTAVKATKDLVDALSPAPSGGSSSPSSSSSGGTSPQGSPAPAAPTAPTSSGGDSAPKSTRATYGLTIKFGEQDVLKTYKNIVRLTPLPSSTNPFFVYLGPSEDGKSAVFLVDADAAPTGDGDCRPNPDNCEQVVLKKGDVEFFEMQTGTAGALVYELQVVSIAKSTAATKASAARAHARESRAGREYLRQVLAADPEAVAGWDFSSKLGVLVEKDGASADTANVPAAVERAAQGENATTATPAFVAQP